MKIVSIISLLTVLFNATNSFANDCDAISDKFGSNSLVTLVESSPNIYLVRVLDIISPDAPPKKSDSGVSSPFSIAKFHIEEVLKGETLSKNRFEMLVFQEHEYANFAAISYYARHLEIYRNRKQADGATSRLVGGHWNEKKHVPVVHQDHSYLFFCSPNFRSSLQYEIIVDPNTDPLLKAVRETITNKKK